ncbi:hypothetical protein DL762_007618 [Monosporascus cannonballus]|uniref:CHK kinase-like domain-containing protein n=1 Tax=Monosporascus cannonballus TaxID=155416 RepID=A0ABY0H2T8_9PEZI|nr:hypothetical protein DL762_007618 [Monosporascus cannonballus]
MLISLQTSATQTPSDLPEPEPASLPTACSAARGDVSMKQEDYPWITPDYRQSILGLMQIHYARIGPDDRAPVLDDPRDQKRAVVVLGKYYKSRNPKLRCLLHGDAHTGNVYRTPNGSPNFIDFQIMYISSAFHDLAYFVGGALSVTDRRAHEKDIIDHYSKSLAGFGGPAMERDGESYGEIYTFVYV